MDSFDDIYGGGGGNSGNKMLNPLMNREGKTNLQNFGRKTARKSLMIVEAPPDKALKENLKRGYLLRRHHLGWHPTWAEFNMGNKRLVLYQS